MSLESVTDAVARQIATVTGMKAVYASGAGGQGSTVLTIPNDISQTPAAIVRHDGFSLLPGSFERIRHSIRVELYFASASAAVAEKAMLPMVSLCIASFRTNVDLFGTATLGVIASGGPPHDEEVNGKAFLVYPLIVTVLEATAQTYSL